MDMKLATLGLGAALAAALAVACGPDARDPPSIRGQAECVDQDEDGFGPGCEAGADCDDDDPSVTTECLDAGAPSDGAGGAWAICQEGATSHCTFHVDAGPGQPLCVPGERTCVDGTWSSCVPAAED